MGEEKEKERPDGTSASEGKKDLPQENDGHPTEKAVSNPTAEASPSESKENSVEAEPAGGDHPKGKVASNFTAGASPSPEKTKNRKPEEKESAPKRAFQSETSEEKDDGIDGIDQENAEDAEDTDNKNRHTIPLLDYESMSMENLVGELQKLVRNEKVQAIKKHVDGIKYEFDQKFDAFLEGKKEKFIEGGGNEIDFKYNSTVKRQFNEVYKDYREKRDQYYKNREKDLKENLSERLAIIKELKGLTSAEEDMGSNYKTFKNLQGKWRNAGPIPRDSYNNVWRTYRHHVEIFYDFLHLNRELRDLDFKHNLEEKEKLVQRAEALANEPDIDRVFRELQALHKIWKEDIGPVGQENREEIWERFSRATKVLHQKRQDHYQELEKTYERNLEEKKKIIGAITRLTEDIADNYRGLQKQVKQLEEHRKSFFAVGKVPRGQNKKIWTAFKDAVRSFNRKKNSYYKNLKQEQQENLDKKRELLELAEKLKDSEDFDSATPEVKRIQAEWKKIGHVPRKYSDKIWKKFKKACNRYFDRLHALKDKGRQEEEANFEKKQACLKELDAFEPSGDRDENLKAIKSFIERWKSCGRVPFKKKNIDQKFNKSLDALFHKLDVGRKEAELSKYDKKVQRLADSDSDYAIGNERSFIRKKIEEGKGEIRQLETNLQFFSNASEENPLIRDVVQRVEVHKESLAVWKAKLKKLNIMENRLNREADDEDSRQGLKDQENQ